MRNKVIVPVFPSSFLDLSSEDQATFKEAAHVVPYLRHAAQYTDTPAVVFAANTLIIEAITDEVIDTHPTDRKDTLRECALLAHLTHVKTLKGLLGEHHPAVELLSSLNGKMREAISMGSLSLSDTMQGDEIIEGRPIGIPFVPSGSPPATIIQ